MYGLYDATRTYFVSINKAMIPMVIQLTCSTLHIFWCYLFVYVYHFDLEGIALATTVSNTLLFILITLVGCFSTDDTIRKSWVFPNKETFNDMYQFL